LRRDKIQGLAKYLISHKDNIYVYPCFTLAQAKIIINTLQENKTDYIEKAIKEKHERERGKSN
jgi:hypothetical protein